jgi:DNA adenine methylase
MSKPLIKWVGGKRQLMSKIKELLPENYNRYFEPFIGGGAVFFELKHENSFINDYNPELTNLYLTVKNKPKELIEDLKKHVNTEEYYFYIRNLDRNHEEYIKLSDVEKASRFIFLNRTCFNGIYRVNSKGQNNVPYGKYSNPKIVDEENILSCSKLLETTTIMTGDFENIKVHINPGDLVYLDPPYVPLTDTANFTSYTDKGFDSSMQLRVRELCDYIDSIGAYFIVSNSSAPLVLELYRNYEIQLVSANRSLSASTEGRAKVMEVLVKNF